MKGGPTVVQGTPVGQADMTVPRSFTSGLCDCCNDGKTCLAVWCCSPITTAQLWQYTFGQPGSCLVISVILFALVGVGQILNFQIQNAILETCGLSPAMDNSDYYSYSLCAQQVEPALSQIASYTSAVLFAAVFFMTCQYAARRSGLRPLRAQASRAPCAQANEPRLRPRQGARRDPQARPDPRLVLRRWRLRGLLLLVVLLVLHAGADHAPRRHEGGQLQPVRARRHGLSARERPRRAAQPQRKSCNVW